MMRTAQINRKTNETDISLRLNLDGTGVADCQSGCGFLDHMLTLFARHGRFDLTVRCAGDVYVDDEFCGADYLADYWDMAQACGWDLNLPEIRWPKNLLQAHDRAMEARKVVRSRELKADFEKRFRVLGKLAYASGELMILPAAGQEQLTKEGQRLNHCVAGYGESHATGKTAIFFIRRVADPFDPYYTLELNEKKLEVKQNRGRNNCARTPEVTVFEEEWLAWVRDGAPRQKDGTPVGARPVRVINREEKKSA